MFRISDRGACWGMRILQSSVLLNLDMDSLNLTLTENNFWFISGAALGTVLSILFSGYIYKWQGWEAVFYWMGCTPAVWCLLWIWLVADDPTKQRYITEKERILIQNSLGVSHPSHTVSCSSFFTSAFFFLYDLLLLFKIGLCHCQFLCSIFAML